MMEADAAIQTLSIMLALGLVVLIALALDGFNGHS